MATKKSIKKITKKTTKPKKRTAVKRVSKSSSRSKKTVAKKSTRLKTTSVKRPKPRTESNDVANVAENPVVQEPYAMMPMLLVVLLFAFLSLFALWYSQDPEFNDGTLAIREEVAEDPTDALFVNPFEEDVEEEVGEYENPFDRVINDDEIYQNPFE